MRKMGLSKALSLLARTAAFIPWRLVLGIGAAVFLMIAIAGGLAVSEALLGQVATEGFGLVPGVLLGLVIWAGAAGLFRGIVLARVRVPHLAAMVALIDGDTVPGGQAQVTTAQAIVQAQFGRSPAVGRLERLVRSVVSATINLVDDGIGAEEARERPGLLARARRIYRKVEVGPISEAVLGHALRDATENGWDRAHDGTVLFAQNSAQVLGVTGRLVLSGWCFAAMVFLALLEPFAALTGAMASPAESGALTLGLALAFAWGLKVAVINPVISACVLQLFLAATAGQKPNAEWRGLLAYSVLPFRKLGEGAETWRPDPGSLPIGQN